MAYNISNIIRVSTKIRPSGLGFANFASATLFAPESELPAGFAVDTRRVYSGMTELGVDFGSGTETYQAANRWLGATPGMGSLTVYGVANADADWTTTLNKARTTGWWYWTFVTAPVYADIVTAVPAIAAWCNSNESFFINCQTGSSATAIRTPASSNIAKTLTTSGYRYAATMSHATDEYAGIAIAPWLAIVNYNALNTATTAEYKKLSGVAAESLTSTEYSAMTDDEVRSMFYSTVELQGSTDSGRVINSITHSAFGEYLDDVVNLDAFINAINVNAFNRLANTPTKLKQTPAGQSVLIGSVRETCEQYITNGYLGPRNYTDPDDGQEKFTVGYEVLTQPEEILDLTEAQRDARDSVPNVVRIFRAGAIHKAIVDISVY